MSGGASPTVDPVAVARKAVSSRWATVLISTVELQALSAFALTTIAAIDEIAAFAEDAIVEGTTIDGAELLNVLSHNRLYSQELYDHNIKERRNGEARAEGEDEGLDPAGPADPGGDV
ncbi:MAG: hypothetical protein WD928_05170 [Gammaproteobacteria bacterium]